MHFILLYWECLQNLKELELKEEAGVGWGRRGKRGFISRSREGVDLPMYSVLYNVHCAVYPIQ